MASVLRAPSLVAACASRNLSKQRRPTAFATTRASRKDHEDVELSLQRLSFRLEATEAELEIRDAQLQSSYADQNELVRRLEQAHAELSEEHLGRIAAEKALDSLQSILEETLVDIRAIEEARDAAEAACKHEAASRHRQVAELEEDIQYAAKEAKLYLHREMEALAEVENHKETIDLLKGENAKLRNQLVELQTKMTFADGKEEMNAGKKTNAKPAKNSTSGTGKSRINIKDIKNIKNEKNEKNQNNGSTLRIPNAEVVPDLSELEQALEDEARATKRRSYEIRAEAALLVETVEDRAVELVEKAQREVAVLKAELEHLKGGSSSEDD